MGNKYILMEDQIIFDVPILCCSEEEAKQLCLALALAGYIWESGEYLAHNTHWCCNNRYGSMYYIPHRTKTVTFSLELPMRSYYPYTTFSQVMRPACR